MKKLHLLLLAGAVLAGLAMTRDSVCAPAAATGAEGKAAVVAGTTLENLQAAFNGESNAQAKYLAFAKKADAEGYGAVGSLFRATAKAEGVHAANHAAVIKALGAEPKAEVKDAEVKGTAENLKAALEGETFEKESMYPAYIQVATKEQNREALKSLNYAKMAESQHAKLYAQAIEELAQLKDSKGVTWYVCPTCGETVRGDKLAALAKCPICFKDTETFTAVN